MKMFYRITGMFAIILIGLSLLVIADDEAGGKVFRILGLITALAMMIWIYILGLRRVSGKTMMNFGIGLLPSLILIGLGTFIFVQSKDSMWIEEYKDFIKAYPTIKISLPSSDTSYRKYLPIEFLMDAPVDSTGETLIQPEKLVMFLSYPNNYSQAVLEDRLGAQLLPLNTKIRTFMDIKNIPPGVYVLNVVLHYNGRFETESIDNIILK